MRTAHSHVLAAILAAALSTPCAADELMSATTNRLAQGMKPRLVVVISVDQFRTDYVTRNADLFLPATGDTATTAGPGGFRWLMTHGAFMASARYTHFPTFTGPGHATLLTGATLGGSGIIANSWLTSAGLSMYCVEDDQTSVVGGPPRRGSKRGTSSSPRNLQAETVGDALRLSNNRASKVVGIAIKDRASILMTGKNPTAAVWFDDESGNWVTSSYYAPDGALPAFAERANRERVADRAFGKSWDKLLPPAAYSRSAPEGGRGAGNAAGMPPTFPKILTKPGTAAPDSAYWRRMTFSPYGNDMVFATARIAIEDEKLGQRPDAPSDMLCLNLSSNDYVGHSYGPDSAEVQDMTVRLDRQLSEFIGYLRQTVRGVQGTAINDEGLVIVLTSDHGVAPLPDHARDTMRYDAGRQPYPEFTRAAEDALRMRFPDVVTSGLVTGFGEPYLYLNLPKAKAMGLDLPAAREAIAERLSAVHGVRAAYPRERIERGQLPPSAISQAIYNGFHEQRSGDVVVVTQPFWYPTTSMTGTTHGSSFSYDAQVPLFIANGAIRPGVNAKPVDIRDLAPTLSLLLGIQAPASSNGRVLDEILR